MSAVLEAHGIVKRFGGVTAVGGVDLAVHEDEIVGLIGPNGAGKTTLFDCLCGYQQPDEGRVTLGGSDVSKLPPEERARRGLGRTFQRLEVFASLTVREHLVLAAEQRRDTDVAAVVEDALDRYQLRDQVDQVAGELPTGTLRRLEVARAACTGASVLLLDEPASGLDPQEVRDLASILGGLSGTGRAALIVEHDVGFVLEVVDRVIVLATGEVIAEGPPDAIVSDARVRAAYLGEGH